MSKNYQIKTRQLILRPFTVEETAALIERTAEPEMKKAYSEMLQGAQKDPDHAVWYLPWGMELRKGGEIIGDLCFKGPAKDDAVEIGYGIHPEYEGQGYTTEAAKALINWAFKDKKVFFVEAEAEAGNAASIRILEKLGMQQYGQGDEGPRYVLAKPVKKWMGTCICLGMCIGIVISNFFNGSTTAGFTIGICLGVAMGLYYENDEKKKLKEAWERRNTRLSEQPTGENK